MVGTLILMKSEQIYLQFAHSNSYIILYSYFVNLSPL